MVTILHAALRWDLGKKRPAFGWTQIFARYDWVLAFLHDLGLTHTDNKVHYQGQSAALGASNRMSGIIYVGGMARSCLA